AWPFAFLSLGLLCLTLVPGLSRTTMGANRWLVLGPLQFQPSEFCKIASLLLMAAGLSKHFWWHRQIAARIGISMVMALIVMKQPDLGTTLMIMGGMLALLYASGTNHSLLLSSLGVGGFAVWHHVQKTPYQMKRIASWLNPYLS